MSNIRKSLLPQGFHDHLPPQAITELRINSVVINSLTLFGYELVRPALVEFEESLDKDFSSDFFKITDTISGKMMVIRNDITPQIARIIKDRYGENALNKTIRLAYTGQVIKKYTQGKQTERQLTQTGYEVISKNSTKKDAEVLYIAIETLEKIGLKDFTIDICYPKLTKNILEEKSFTKEEISETIKKIEAKDLKAISEDKRLKEIIDIIKISDEATDLKSSIKALSNLEKNISLVYAKKAFQEVKEILETLSKSVENINVSLNLLEMMNFDYHCGMCYSFISHKNLDEIGRGGRYKIAISKEDSLYAVGFTFLINSILKNVEFEIKHDSRKVNYDEGFASSKNLRDRNIATIFE
jgi:ATP phosphoribosyltransferase regulatory subunit